jgi:hypothetical protein
VGNTHRPEVERSRIAKRLRERHPESPLLRRVTLRYRGSGDEEIENFAAKE